MLDREKVVEPRYIADTDPGRVVDGVRERGCRTADPDLSDPLRADWDPADAAPSERAAGAGGGRGSAQAHAKRKAAPKGDPVPSYWLIPWSLVALAVILVAIIFWGGFIEERRNGRSLP